MNATEIIVIVVLFILIILLIFFLYKTNPIETEEEISYNLTSGIDNILPEFSSEEGNLIQKMTDWLLPSNIQTEENFTNKKLLSKSYRIKPNNIHSSLNYGLY